MSSFIFRPIVALVFFGAPSATAFATSGWDDYSFEVGDKYLFEGDVSVAKVFRIDGADRSRLMPLCST